MQGFGHCGLACLQMHPVSRGANQPINQSINGLFTWQSTRSVSRRSRFKAFVSTALDGLGQVCLLLTCSIDAMYNICCQTHTSATARLAQSAERKALNLVVVGSSPTVGVFSSMWLIRHSNGVKLASKEGLVITVKPSPESSAPLLQHYSNSKWLSLRSRSTEHRALGLLVMSAVRKRSKSTPVGFEPTRRDPIGLAGGRLNHSAKVFSDCGVARQLRAARRRRNLRAMRSQPGR